MYFTRNLLLVIAILFFGKCIAQENFIGYWQPMVNLSYPVSTNYSHNNGLVNRNYIYDEALQLRVRQFDVFHFSKLKILDNQSLSFGVLYRFRNVFENSSNEIRLTQQYNITTKPFVARYGHRFRTEQRITSNSTVHRFRYRLAIDFPLQGEKLDIGEPYFIASTEGLLSVARSNKPSYDLRYTANLGWELRSGLKLQTGMEYRTENFNNQTAHVFFLLSELRISL